MIFSDRKNPLKAKSNDFMCDSILFFLLFRFYQWMNKMMVWLIISMDPFDCNTHVDWIWYRLKNIASSLNCFEFISLLFLFKWMLRHESISCASEALRPQNGCLYIASKAINAVNNINQLWLEPKVFQFQMINFCWVATVSFP